MSCNQPSGSTHAGSGVGTGGGTSTPLPIQNRLCPRHCIAAIPTIHGPPPDAGLLYGTPPSVPAAGPPAAGPPRARFRQHGIVQSGLPLQQDGLSCSGVVVEPSSRCCAQQGIDKSGLAVQQDGLSCSGGDVESSSRCCAQQLRTLHSAVVQPQAANVSAETGTPNAVTRYATRVTAAVQRRRNECQKDCRLGAGIEKYRLRGRCCD
jgi:hypothetical protein